MIKSRLNRFIVMDDAMRRANIYHASAPGSTLYVSEFIFACQWTYSTTTDHTWLQFMNGQRVAKGYVAFFCRIQSFIWRFAAGSALDPISESLKRYLFCFMMARVGLSNHYKDISLNGNLKKIKRCRQVTFKCMTTFHFMFAFYVNVLLGDAKVMGC